MAPAATKQDVKDAIREVMDDIAVTYAHGAGTFLETIIKASGDVAGAFDNFYTRNLIEDRPDMARLFIELRIKSTRQLQAVVESRLHALTTMEAELEASSARKGTQRRRATKSTSRSASSKGK